MPALQRDRRKRLGPVQRKRRGARFDLPVTEKMSKPTKTTPEN